MKRFLRKESHQTAQNEPLVWNMTPLDVRLAFDKQSIEQWRDGLTEGSSDRELYLVLMEKLAPVFEFISINENPLFMAVRCWVLLYMVRPDLIDYETTLSAAKRFGLRDQQLREQIANFRTAFSSVTWPTRQRDDTGRSRAQRCARTQRRHRLLKSGGEVHHDFQLYQRERDVA